MGTLTKGDLATARVLKRDFGERTAEYIAAVRLYNEQKSRLSLAERISIESELESCKALLKDAAYAIKEALDSDEWADKDRKELLLDSRASMKAAHEQLFISCEKIKAVIKTEVLPEASQARIEPEKITPQMPESKNMLKKAIDSIKGFFADIASKFFNLTEPAPQEPQKAQEKEVAGGFSPSAFAGEDAEEIRLSARTSSSASVAKSLNLPRESISAINYAGDAQEAAREEVEEVQDDYAPSAPPAEPDMDENSFVVRNRP